MIFNNTSTDTLPNPSSINAQLHKILSSSEFHASELQAKILAYVVQESVSGRAASIKGYAIATQVLGRSLDFDQATDPIVSIHANKLRRALERYYLVAGSNDEIRIDIPKGSYAPIFIKQQNLPLSPETSPVTQTPGNSFWPKISILPFKNLAGRNSVEVINHTIVSGLLVELSYAKEFNIYLATDTSEEYLAHTGSFILSGVVFQDSDYLEITVHLRSPYNNEQIFAETFKLTSSESMSIVSQKELVGKIAAKIAGENGAVIRHLIANLSKEKIEEHTPHEAILRYYIFCQDSNEKNGQIALAALAYVTEKYPHVGLAWSLLARLYIGLFSFGAPEFEQYGVKARRCAEKGVCVDPHNQRVLMIMAFVLFIVDDLDSSKHYLFRSAEAFSESTLYLDLQGYLFTLSGEWEIGVGLIQKAMRLNPHYSPIVHYALWLYNLHTGDYKQAYIESTCIVRSSIYWYYLAFAISLGLIGRFQEGKMYCDELLKIRPDFWTRGHKLIGHFIKSDSTRNLVKKVLQKYNLILQ